MAANGYYHCSVKSVSRATGRSAVAAAAYRSGERLADDRTGLVHDYRAKAGVLGAFIVVPENAPVWAYDRSELWNRAEAATKAVNGRVATELELALPSELSAEQRRALVEGFARSIADAHNVAVDVALHAPGKEGDHRNYHAHVLVSHREIGTDGFGEICNRRTVERTLRGQRKQIQIAGFTTSEDTAELRTAWASAVNRAYADAGLDIRVDHRSHADRGLKAEPTQHLGPRATGIERRGEASERGNENRAAMARNAERERIEAQRVTLAAAIADLAAERQARIDGREIREAVRTESAARILDAITEKRATFTSGELTALLMKGVDTRDEAKALAGELLNSVSVIGLRETANDPVSRYTTRAVIAAENEVLATGRALANRAGRGLSEADKNRALKDHKHLDEEQREAFDRATGRAGLTILAGEAGTGKSTTLAAVRDAYEGAGFRVVGLAWTNSVVQDMAADGFKDSSTISAALGRIERGKGSGYQVNRKGVAMPKRGQGGDMWTPKTVLVVDEAAMLSSFHLGRVLDEARQAGARVILAGDDRQLASIERGGMFGALKDEHGAAELHTVRRVQDAAQQRAFNYMHAGKFGAALDIFDQSGAIRWTQTQDEARAALVGQWAADTKAQPDKARFVFAYSNRDVDALNADLRAIRRERGELGEDHRLQTKDGPADFAKGDRVQFTGSAYGAAERRAGLVTGAVGTISGIEGGRVTVELDGRGGKKGRAVSFAVGEHEEAGQFNAIRHGYAGTIYKGQGRTLDQSYLYHSQGWRSATAYVALSRHRERTGLFVAREVTRGAEPWMMAEGGLAGLDERQKASAERSYEAWAEEKPGLGAKHGLADYVAYVQGKQSERGRSAFDMEQLARQIGRADESRAASQFIKDGEGDKGRGAQRGKETASGGPRPRLSGPDRYAVLRATAKAATRRVGDPLAALLAKVDPNRKAAPLGKYDVLSAEAEAAKKAAHATKPAATTEAAKRTPNDLDDLMPRDIRKDVEKLAAERKQGRDRSKGPEI